MLLCLHMICSYPRVMLPAGGAEVLRKTVTITLAQGAGESTPVPPLNIAHYEPTGYAVQRPFMDGPAEFQEFTLVPKVSQDW